MNKIKLSLITIITLIGLTVFAQPGALALSPQSDTISVSNSLPEREYAVERSFDLLSWEMVTPRFNGVGTNTLKVFGITNAVGVPNFYRIHDITDLTNGNIFVSANIGASPGNSPPCPGAYAGYGNYLRTAAQGWGFEPDSTNMNYFVAYTAVGGRTDAKVYYVSDHGETDCSTNNFIVGFSGENPVRFSVFFPGSVPTNPYTIMLKGFKPLHD